jgi:hypothetical protein
MSEIVSFSPFTFSKVEAAVAAIVVPGLKIRASGGFDFPGYTVFPLTGVILFGAKIAFPYAGVLPPVTVSQASVPPAPPPIGATA